MNITTALIASNFVRARWRWSHLRGDTLRRYQERRLETSYSHLLILLFPVPLIVPERRSRHRITRRRARVHRHRQNFPDLQLLARAVHCRVLLGLSFSRTKRLRLP